MQTARSTEEIARHIGQVRSATGASVAAVARIDQTIAEISAIAGSIAAAVRQQDAATAEIARNVAATAEAANEMTGRTNDVSHEAAGTGRHAADLRDNTVALNHGGGRTAPFGDQGGADLDRRRGSTPGPALCGGHRGAAVDCRTKGEHQVRSQRPRRRRCLRCAVPRTMPAGARGALQLDGVRCAAAVRRARGRRRRAASGLRAR